MDNTKSPKNVSLKNQLELWLFCALIGAVAGALVWILLKIMAVGTEFLWKWLPGKTTVPYYTILICVAGAAIIGIFRKIFGDYPEDLETVMGKVRTEKRYEYKNMLVMMVAALLPLLIGSLNKGFQIIYLRNRAGCRHWYLCRFICTFWCRAFRISIL